LEKSLNWIESLGITIGNSRIRQYKEEITKAFSAENYDYEKFMAISFETSLWIRVYEEFPRTKIESLKLMIPIILSGPLLQSSENPDKSGNRARNKQYEIILGCTFSQENLGPKFGIEREDLNFSFNGKNVFVECKRPWSEKGIEDSLKDGIRQLRNRFTAENPNEKGILGLCIDRVANPKSVSPAFETIEDAQNSMLDHTREILIKYKGKLRQRFDPKIAGLICSFYSPIESKAHPSDVVIVNMNTFIPMADENDENFLFMENLNQFMNKRFAPK
jgi:hypothetical protein